MAHTFLGAEKSDVGDEAAAAHHRGARGFSARTRGHSASRARAERARVQTREALDLGNRCSRIGASCGARKVTSHSDLSSSAGGVLPEEGKGSNSGNGGGGGGGDDNPS